MTLQEQLNQYIEKYCLSGAEAARRIGTHPSQVSQIRLRNVYTPALAEKIYKAFGDEFREYFEYDTCPYCGSEYIPRDERQKNMLVRRVCEKASGRGRERIRTKSKLGRTCHEDVKPPVTFTEFNERARSQGLSYGQLQGLERLGLR